MDGTVDARPHEPLGVELRHQPQVLALAGRDDRGQEHQLLALGKAKHLVDHLGDGLGLQGLAVLGAPGGTDPGVEESQVVVDLGDGSDGRARVVGGGLLLDGDRRGQTFDVVQVRLFHHREELAGIRRQRLHIPPLTLGIDGVEGERGLTRAREPGQHNQAIARQVQVQILEVVGAGAADADTVHGPAWPEGCGRGLGSTGLCCAGSGRPGVHSGPRVAYPHRAGCPIRATRLDKLVLCEASPDPRKARFP